MREDERAPLERDVHSYFGLSYASWLVLPRVILEAMPADWQFRFVQLLSQIDEEFDWLPSAVSLTVAMRGPTGKYTRFPRIIRDGYRHPDKKLLDSLRRKE